MPSSCRRNATNLSVPLLQRSQANKRWKGLELRLTDAANEAKDNVRYLATLDQPFEVRTQPYSCRLRLGGFLASTCRQPAASSMRYSVLSVC
jgi:hypothetical protein